MTKITREQIKRTHEVIVHNAYTNQKEKPDFITKTNFKAFKKFGTNKCLWCKEYFIKHRLEHHYCSAKCRIYHHRKMGVK